MRFVGIIGFRPNSPPKLIIPYFKMCSVHNVVIDKLLEYFGTVVDLLPLRCIPCKVEEMGTGGNAQGEGENIGIETVDW